MAKKIRNEDKQISFRTTEDLHKEIKIAAIKSGKGTIKEYLLDLHRSNKKAGIVSDSQKIDRIFNLVDEISKWSIWGRNVDMIQIRGLNIPKNVQDVLKTANMSNKEANSALDVMDILLNRNKGITKKALNAILGFSDNTTPVGLEKLIELKIVKIEKTGRTNLFSLF